MVDLVRWLKEQGREVPLYIAQRMAWGKQRKQKAVACEKRNWTRFCEGSARPIASAGCTWSEFYSDDEPGPVADTLLTERAELLEEALSTISYREREVIKLHYGLGYDATHSLDEIGQIFKITRERVRQIEKKAIRRLSEPWRSRTLASTVNDK